MLNSLTGPEVASQNYKQRKRDWEAAAKRRDLHRRTMRSMKRRAYGHPDRRGVQTDRQMRKFDRRVSTYPNADMELQLLAFDNHIQSRWDARRLDRGTSTATGPSRTRRL